MKSSEQWWRVQALCRRHPDPDIWFPDPKGVKSPNRLRNTREAKAICHECPVFYACKSFAVEAVNHPAKYGKLQGIWAGVDVGTAIGRQMIRSVVQTPSEFGRLAVMKARAARKRENGPLTA